MGTQSRQDIAEPALRSDEPIRSYEDDRLARGPLVDVIARHILHCSTSQSVVVALNAPWGAGKSSFLNLLEKKLGEPSGSGAESVDPIRRRPVVIRFNPWNYDSVETLVQIFFAELARGVGKSADKAIAKKVGTGLQAIGELTSVFHTGAGTLLKKAGGALNRSKSLEEIKAELDSLLVNLDQRIVVFVDDIDRLERDTLRLLFRVIRLNACFPNVTYVLAFDRLVVERSLNEESGIRGRDYLEKIIQVAFDIPAPEAATRDRILFAELDVVLATMKTRPLDEQRWGDVLHAGLRSHFRTIRHIKRYANGLRVTLTPVAEEVDLVDFMAAELIRTFHPDVYAGLAEGKHMLAPVRMGDRDSIPAPRLREWVDQLCKRASPGFEESVRAVLRVLFPELARVYANTSFGDGYDAKWRRECRICSPAAFDKYFLLGVPEGEISEVEIQAFVDGLSDPSIRASFLARMIASGQARRLLERLEDFTRSMPRETAVALIGLLFDSGASIQYEPRGFFELSSEMQVSRIVYQCLLTLPTEQERLQVLLPLVRSGASFSTAIHEVSLSEPRDSAQAGPPAFADRCIWEQLRDAALERIESQRAAGTLWSAKTLPYVLFRWRAWRDELTVRAAIAEHVADDQALVGVLENFIARPTLYVEGRKTSPNRESLRPTTIEPLFDVPVVLNRLRVLAEGDGGLARRAGRLIELLEAPTSDGGYS